MSKTAHPRNGKPTRWAMVNGHGQYWTGWVWTAKHTTARTWPRRKDVLAYIRGYIFLDTRAEKLP